MAVRTFNEATEIREMTKLLALAPVAGSLTNTFIAPTAFVDGVEFVQTGRELVVVRNFHATLPQTFTIKSVVDELNRLGDIGPYSLAIGESATFIINPKGFKSVAASKVTIVMSDVLVKVAVNRIPNLVAT